MNNEIIKKIEAEQLKSAKSSVRVFVERTGLFRSTMELNALKKVGLQKLLHSGKQWTAARR